MEPFYVLSFDTTSHSMYAEKLAKERFRVQMIPTPREITASCGLSLRFEAKDWDSGALCIFWNELEIPCHLHRMEPGAGNLYYAKRMEDGHAVS